MKKALYLHGFLGNPKDMWPLRLEGYDCECLDLKKYLAADSFIEAIYSDLKEKEYHYALGYSMGGRILKELLIKGLKSKHNFFCSSRLSAHSSQEVLQRKELKKKSMQRLESSLPSFLNFWNALELFSGHSMSDYRKKYGLNSLEWTDSDIQNYFEKVFLYDWSSWPELNRSDLVSCFLYGSGDSKYSREAQILDIKSRAFEGGHRFLFEEPAVLCDFLKQELEILS